jgi:hypothetical protein
MAAVRGKKRANLVMAGYLILIRMLCVCVVSAEEALVIMH